MERIWLGMVVRFMRSVTATDAIAVPRIANFTVTIFGSKIKVESRNLYGRSTLHLQGLATFTRNNYTRRVAALQRLITWQAGEHARILPFS